MKENSTIAIKAPIVRFAGFTDSWEQRKLGDILIEFVSKTKVENEFPVFSSTNKGIELRKVEYPENQIRVIKLLK
jgi:type I restriction enzyme S subunit